MPGRIFGAAVSLSKTFHQQAEPIVFAPTVTHLHNALDVATENCGLLAIKNRIPAYRDRAAVCGRVSAMLYEPV